MCLRRGEGPLWRELEVEPEPRWRRWREAGRLGRVDRGLPGRWCTEIPTLLPLLGGRGGWAGGSLPAASSSLHAAPAVATTKSTLEAPGCEEAGPPPGRRTSLSGHQEPSPRWAALRREAAAAPLSRGSVGFGVKREWGAGRGHARQGGTDSRASLPLPCLASLQGGLACLPQPWPEPGPVQPTGRRPAQAAGGQGAPRWASVSPCGKRN